VIFKLFFTLKPSQNPYWSEIHKNSTANLAALKKTFHGGNAEKKFSLAAYCNKRNAKQLHKKLVEICINFNGISKACNLEK
jgi:hypothetical protein